MPRKFIPDPPFCIQVEFCEGCNLYCEFCGLRGIRKGPGGPYKLMTKKTAEAIAMSIAEHGWNSRIEFAMHGEPTMNPDYINLVGIFREYLPKNQLMMTSNGGGLLKKPGPVKNVEDLFEAGLNVLALDNYVNYNVVPKVRKKLEAMTDAEFNIWDYPSTIEASPHKRWGRKAKEVIIVEDISVADIGSHASLNNHCGAAGPLDHSAQGKRCAKPFRELTVRWDGNVAFCCNDWRGTLNVGNVHKRTLKDIWHDDIFHAARKHLYHGMRTFTPCYGCNALSYRVGLLPDHRGKQSMPRPNKADKVLLAESVAKQKLLAKPVYRDWEKRGKIASKENSSE